MSAITHSNQSQSLSDVEFSEGIDRLLTHIDRIETPALVFDHQLLIHHLEILKAIQDKTGCSILYALKAACNKNILPLINRYLKGCCATSINEAKLGNEFFDGELHVYRPAFSPKDIDVLGQMSDHIVVNSVSQYQRIKGQVNGGIGLRINPQVSVTSDSHEALYNPCKPGSRLGARKEECLPAWEQGELEGIEGLHVHALCGSSAEDLAAVVDRIEQDFGALLASDHVKWLNLGGGHYITTRGYNRELLCNLITRLQTTYKVKIYLEPGETVLIDTGYYITTIDDVKETDGDTVLVMDGSASAHMHDAMHMPFRPEVLGAANPESDDYEASLHPYVYRFGGNTCMCGDMVPGQFAFNEVMLAPKSGETGRKHIFLSAVEYSSVLYTTFNGVPWPHYYVIDRDGDIECVRDSRYEDFFDHQ